MRIEKAAVVVLGLSLPGCTSRPPMPVRPATSPAPAAQAQPPATGSSPAAKSAPAASPAAASPAVADSSANTTPNVKSSGAASAPTGDLFAARVGPLLARKCTPCHVPGGRMYDRLPFDDPATVRRVKEGVLRRLKVPEDRSVLEAWLGTQPKE